MREDATAERVRMNDEQYINWHLNTPGYRLYRPAWKMISWHVKDGEDRQNQRKQLILDSLTDAQKRANTTRGSTPGLINPALGEIPGNRIKLPALGAVKGNPRPKRAAVSVNNESATQPAQQSQSSQAQQVVQVTQTPQALRSSQTPPHVQNQQVMQSARARNSHVAAAPSPVTSVTMGATSQRVVSGVTAQVFHSPTWNLKEGRLTRLFRGTMTFKNTPTHRLAMQPLCHHHRCLQKLGTISLFGLKYLVYKQNQQLPPTGHRKLVITKPTLRNSMRVGEKIHMCSNKEAFA